MHFMRLIAFDWNTGLIYKLSLPDKEETAFKFYGVVKCGNTVFHVKGNEPLPNLNVNTVKWTDFASKVKNLVTTRTRPGVFLAGFGLNLGVIRGKRGKK